jgi:hypothetical protein
MIKQTGGLGYKWHGWSFTDALLPAVVILQHTALSVARDMLKICPAVIRTKSGKTSSA